MAQTAAIAHGANRFHGHKSSRPVEPRADPIQEGFSLLISYNLIHYPPLYLDTTNLIINII